MQVLKVCTASRSGQGRTGEGREKKNQDVESYEERRKTQEENGSAVVGGDGDGERRQRQRRQGRGSEQEGVQGSTMRSHLPNCLLPLWGKLAVAPGGTGDGPGGTRVHCRYFQRLLQPVQLVQGHETLEC